MLAGARKSGLFLALAGSLLLHGTLLVALWWWYQPLAQPDSEATALRLQLNRFEPASAESPPPESSPIEPIPAAAQSHDRPALPESSPEPVVTEAPIEPPPDTPAPVSRSESRLDLSLPGVSRETSHPMFAATDSDLPVFDASSKSVARAAGSGSLPGRDELPLSHQATRFAPHWQNLDQRTPYQALTEDRPALGFVLGLFKTGPKSNPNCPMYMKPEDCLSPFPQTH